MDLATSKMVVRADVSVYQDYTIYHRTTGVNTKGTTYNTYLPSTPPQTLKMARTQMRAREVEQYRRMEHPATHKFVLKGGIPLDSGVPIVGVGDRFVKDGQEFEIVAKPQNPLSLDLFTIFITAEV